MDNARLRRLDASDNPGPGALGVAALCRVLDPLTRVNPTLAELRLRACGLSDARGAALMLALTNNRSLTVLDLSDNECGVETARAMRLMAETNKTLGYVDLSRNRIDAVAAETVAASMRDAIETGTASLEFLSLARNGIGDVACATLAEAMAVDGTLKEMDLCATRAGPKAARATATRFAPTDARTLFLDGNPLGEEDARRSSPRRNRRGTERGCRCAGVGTRPRRRTSCARHARGRSRSSAAKEKKKKNRKNRRRRRAKSGAAPAAAPAVQVRQARRRRRRFRYRRRRRFGSERGAFDPSRPDGHYALDLADEGCREVAERLFRLEDDVDPDVQRVVNIL